MLGYLSADMICSEKRTVFRERSSRKTVSKVQSERWKTPTSLSKKLYRIFVRNPLSANTETFFNISLWQLINRLKSLLPWNNTDCKLPVNWGSPENGSFEVVKSLKPPYRDLPFTSLKPNFNVSTTLQLVCRFFFFFLFLKDVNECNHNSCENGGTCKLKDGEHQCHCPRDFTGSLCEIRKCQYWNIF